MARASRRDIGSASAIPESVARSTNVRRDGLVTSVGVEIAPRVVIPAYLPGRHAHSFLASLCHWHISRRANVQGAAIQR